MVKPLRKQMPCSAQAPRGPFLTSWRHPRLAAQGKHADSLCVTVLSCGRCEPDAPSRTRGAGTTQAHALQRTGPKKSLSEQVDASQASAGGSNEHSSPQPRLFEQPSN